MSKIIGFSISLIAILLPPRLRILFSEILGWITQFFYFSYYGTLNYILKELNEDKRESNEE